MRYGWDENEIKENINIQESKEIPETKVAGKKMWRARVWEKKR